MPKDIETISDVLLFTGEHLVILFPTYPTSSSQVGVPGGRAFFFKILAARRFRFRYDLLANLAPLTGVAYNFLGDVGLGLGNDVLRIEDDRFWSYHIGYAPLQDDLRVYHRLSNNVNPQALEYTIPTLPDPTAGTDFEYIVGNENANYYDPHVDTELICFRNREAGTMHEFGFFNEGPNLIDPVLNLYGRGYLMIPIVKEESINKILDGRIKAHLINFGTLTTYRDRTFLPKFWIDVKNDRLVSFEDITGVESPRM